MMKQKKWFIACLSFAMATTQAASLQEIKDQKLIRVGVSATKPPFGFVGGEFGDSIGFEAELGRELAQELFGDPEKVDFELLESVNRIPYLENNQVDVVIANFTVTPERQQVVDFADPYIKTQLGILSRDSAPITDVKQLAGKTLIVPEGTIAESFFQENYPDIKIKTYKDNASSFINFRKGEGDALSQDNILLFPWAEENKGFVVGVTGIGEEFFIAPAVAKGNSELLAYVNQAMKKFKADGRMDDAYEKYVAPAFGKSAKKTDILMP